MREITAKGKEALGAWVAQVRRSDAMRDEIFGYFKQTGAVESLNDRPTQAQFARWVSERTGILIPEGIINRLEGGKYKTAPPLEVLGALEELGILKFKDGRSCTIEEMFEIMLEELEPVTGKKLNGVH